VSDRIEERLRLLEDRQAILDTLHAYGHALDYGHEAEFMNCWLETASMGWPSGPYVGHEAIAAAFRAHTHAPAAYHKHLVIDPQITIDGDRAEVDSYFVRLDAGPDGPVVKSFGRYRDVLVRCDDGRWRFAERNAERESRFDT
jgi:ketosteroid isomerase-like protein